MRDFGLEQSTTINAADASYITKNWEVKIKKEKLRETLYLFK